MPIACYAVLEGEQIWLRGLVGDPGGGLLLSAEARAPRADAEALGVQVAEDLLSQGAADSSAGRVSNRRQPVTRALPRHRLLSECRRR